MITRKHVGYNEFMEAVNSLHNIECLGCVEDTLLDNLLYIGTNDHNCDIVLLALSTYLNSSASDYTVKIAISEKDKNELYNKFDDLEQLASYYD